LMTRDTVAVDTPAAAATSRIVAKKSLHFSGARRLLGARSKSARLARVERPAADPRTATPGSQAETSSS